MAVSVYSINKGVNKPITFKGLKAQYIWYLCGGLVGLLVVFAIMYILEINTFITLAVIVILASALIMYVYHLSGKYGQYGLMKKLASKYIPKTVKSRSRKDYLMLKR